MIEKYYHPDIVKLISNELIDNIAKDISEVQPIPEDIDLNSVSILLEYMKDRRNVNK